jgi:colanic acid/amylovoran biosynthesis glycosyltransferase
MASPAKPAVGVFCPTFLKPEMLHVYRQVTGIPGLDIHVFAFKRENPERFPFDQVTLLHRSRLRWLRRIWSVQIRKAPQQALSSETTSLTNALEKLRCGLLHIYFGNNGVFWLPFIRRSPIPVIVSFHGADVQVDLDSAVATANLRELFARSALLLTRSESLSEALRQRGCPAAKIRVHRTGIPVERFRFVQRTAPLDGRWRFLQACRLVEKKGLELSLRCFAAVCQGWPGATLTIAGDGPLRQKLLDLAGDLGVRDRVELTGFLPEPELLDLYYRSHLFLHPSESTAEGNREGVPNSLVEAMATGLPTVATWHGGIPEAIEHSVSGVLVAEADLSALSIAVRGLLNDPKRYEAIGREAALGVRERFDLATQLRKLTSLYLEAMGR